MSHNQSRAERSESLQYRKTGRSVNSNQQRQFSSGVSTKAGGGASSGHTNPSNLSSKKYNSNAAAVQPNVGNWIVDSSDSSAVHGVQNGDHQQQPTHRASDTPVNSTSSNPKPTDARSQKISRAAPKPPASSVSAKAEPYNVSNSCTEPKDLATPGKGGASKSFPLQFGSIGPGVMTGMQIPARTSSAPPNLDEQKKDQQAHYESLRTAPALPIPSAPKQHLPKKDAGSLDQPTAVEAHIPSKSKRDAHVSAVQSGPQAHRPSMHPMRGMPMHLPFHQPQIPVQFGGPNPQIQSQAMSGKSLPMPIPMPVPLGNPPVQHSMFISGLQPHPMQSQAMLHQGQSLNFSPSMGPQISPQLANMGLSMSPQFPQQPTVKYSSSRKTVKITHPETHEELRLDSLPAPRLHPGMQSQSQPVSSFPPNIPMNFYPSSYNTTSLFYPPANSVPLNSNQVPLTSQPQKIYNKVTVKPPVVSHAEKESFPPSGSQSIGKAEESKPSRSKGENSAFPHKETEASSLSCASQPKPGLDSAASSGPATVVRDVPLTSAPSTAPIYGTVSAATSSGGARTEVLLPDSIKDKHENPDNRDHLDQDGRLSTSFSSLPSKLLEAEKVEAGYALSGSNFVSETAKESLSTTFSASCGASDLSCEGVSEEKIDDTSNFLETEDVNSRLSKTKVIGRKEQGEAMSAESSKYMHSLETSLRSHSLESPEICGKIDERSDQEPTDNTVGLLEHTQEQTQKSSGYCSNDVNLDNDLSVITQMSGGWNNESSVSSITPDVASITPDVSFNVPDNIDKREIAVAKGALVVGESALVLVSSFCEATSKPENEDIESSSGGLVSPSHVKDNVPDADTVISAAPRGKKKKKELYRKAEAADASSDLYVAYKWPEKGNAAPTKGTENSLSISEKQRSADKPQENAVVCETQGKLEPDDWEDAAEISTPELGTLGSQNVDNDDGNKLTAKRYSRDFLLKFVDQCTDLPEGFEITSDIADAIMVSSVNDARESYHSPGRNVDRPISRSDRRGIAFGDGDKWSKFPGPLVPGRDIWSEVGYIGNIVGFRPGQGGNYGVLRNPRAQSPSQFGGGILPGSMQSLGPQGVLQRINSDSDCWQRGTGFQKGLMPSPQTPMQVMHRAERRYEVGKVNDEEQAKQRQLKAILNKLTPQNFEKLFQQVKEVNIDNVTTLSGVISQIFDKALMEPTFCEMYASFCFHLAADLPELSVDNQKITFKGLLLNKCQEEFERGEREEEEANKVEEEGEAKQSAEQREEKRLRARRRMLGNIRLIGELYKKRMLTERIMHECINKLLGHHQNPDEENIEALCKLMSTIGKMIDHPKAKEHMDAYYDIMRQLSDNMQLSSRVRFMLKDSIDLRKNKWQQRRKVEGPKKIEEVHRDAAQERQAQSRPSRAPSMGNPVRKAPVDFGPRSPNMFSSPNSQISGYRGAPSQLRGYGSQDVRVDDVHSSENRNMSVPPRPLGDDSITLGPQGGLGRVMTLRGQPSAGPHGPLTEMPSLGDGRRMVSGQNGFSSMLSVYSEREDLAPKNMSKRFAAPLNYGHSLPQDRNNTYRDREVPNTDRSFDRSLPTSPPPQGGVSSSTHDMPSDKVLSEEQLRDKSVAAVREYYSARDEKEVALCIKDLNAPSFYPSMISIWVTDSFERKDLERDLLTKLLINLAKLHDRIITQNQLIRGFESVLTVLEDAVNDAPRAAEFLGRIFANVIMENIVSLSDIGQLIYKSGEEQGWLVEVGLAAEVLGSALEVIKLEKGESVLNEMRSSSNLRLEDFRPPGSNKSYRIDKFI